PAYQVYLQLPLDQLSPRTIALAHKIADGKLTSYDKAIAIKDWLDSNLSYTLQLVEPHRGQEPLDFFLFDRKKGHCEYFASAFAILARIVGVPTREVDGFLGGEWNEYQGYVAVRAGDARSQRSARPRRRRLARAAVQTDGHDALPVDQVGDRVRPRRAAVAVQG